eukprot:COSAG04_NODE_2497_length_4008_cov_1.911486_2_plen_382_part_00
MSVDERGSLHVADILVQGVISVATGGSLTAQDSTIATALTVLGTASLSGCTLSASASAASAEWTSPITIAVGEDNGCNNHVHEGAFLGLVDCSGIVGRMTATCSSIDIDTSTSESLTFDKIRLSNAGAVALTGSTIGRGGSVIVGENTQLSLTGCTLTDASSPSFRLTATGGSLSLVSMVVPARLLARMERVLTDSTTGSTVHLDAVSVQEAPDANAITGTATVVAQRHSGSGNHLPIPTVIAIDPEGTFSYGTPTFAVASGPCTVSEGGRCVGRPEGYGPNERCVVTVSGGGGVLAPCAVFDTEHYDFVGTPANQNDGWRGSNCPVNMALGLGDTLGWHSSDSMQGNQGGDMDNGCATKDTCGLPFSSDGLGGGWEVCFA